MPGIVDSVGEWWDRGVADPWQFVDSVTPGDWRQGNRFNRDGLIAGGAQVASSGLLPAALTQPIIGRIGSMLGGGRASDIGRGVANPLRYADDTNAISNAAANYIPGTSTLNRSESELANQRNDVGNVDAGGMGGGNRPRLSRGESAGGGNMGGVTLGLGQLGRGGDESLAAFAASLFARGGTQAEQ